MTTNSEYEAIEELGSNASGMVSAMIFNINITAENSPLGAVLSMAGRMTDETLRCDTKTENNRLHLLFDSYPDGGTINKYGIQLYKKGDVLLSLEKREDGKQNSYKAHWGKISPNTNAEIIFKR